jgi:cell division protein FtsB
MHWPPVPQCGRTNQISRPTSTMSRSTTSTAQIPPARAARRRVQPSGASGGTGSPRATSSSRLGANSTTENSSAPRRSRRSTNDDRNFVQEKPTGRDTASSRATTPSRTRTATSGSPARAQSERPSVPERLEAVNLRLSRPARLCVALLGLVLLLVALSFVGVLPVRTYISQRNELRSKEARVEMLSARNDELNGRIQLLRTDAEVARMARDQFGMVPKGDTLTVLPGLRDESLVLSGNGSSAIGAAPPASRDYQPSFFEAISRLLLFWK